MSCIDIFLYLMLSDCFYTRWIHIFLKQKNLFQGVSHAKMGLLFCWAQTLKQISNTNHFLFTIQKTREQWKTLIIKVFPYIGDQTIMLGWRLNCLKIGFVNVLFMKKDPIALKKTWILKFWSSWIMLPVKLFTLMTWQTIWNFYLCHHFTYPTNGSRDNFNV